MHQQDIIMTKAPIFSKRREDIKTLLNDKQNWEPFSRA